jgi:hypothetical protein
MNDKLIMIHLYDINRNIPFESKRNSIQNTKTIIEPINDKFIFNKIQNAENIDLIDNVKVLSRNNEYFGFEIKTREQVEGYTRTSKFRTIDNIYIKWKYF